MVDAVAATKGLCTLGIIGFLIFAFMYWVSSMVMLSIMNMYYPGTFDSFHYAGVWLRTAFVIAPVSLMCSWHRQSRKNCYIGAMKRTSRIAKTPKRVLVFSIPGVLLGLVGCGLLATLVGAT
jgi:hypothetical protein